MARTWGERLSNDGSRRVVFVFTAEMDYPPVSGNTKAHYVSLELARRGVKVIWARMGPETDHWEQDGREFAKVGRPGNRTTGPWLQLMRLLSFCRKSQASCVYLDDWLFLRFFPGQQLAFQIGLKVLGIGCVFDQRDPFIDIEVGLGNLQEGSWRHKQLILIYRLIAKFTDLTIFPSQVYEAEIRAQGLSSRRSLGVIRGVDPRQFRDREEKRAIRAQLGLDGKFVIGWFGMMLPIRLIDEVLIPLIENLGTKIPNAHFLIGGFGVLEDRFQSLKERRPDAMMTLLGNVPYGELPKYLSACDVLLSPINTDHKITLYSSPIKILESVAVGRPIIASSIKVRESDYKDIKGIVWTGMSYDDFLDSLMAVHADYARYREEAERQAKHFEAFSITSTIAKIADGVEESCK